MNLQQLQDDVLQRLGEAQSSLVAAYLPGNNSTTPVLTSAQVITYWLNDGQNDLARNFYPISDIATVTWPAGQQFMSFRNFVCQGNAGNLVFGIRKVSFAGNALTSAGRAATENWYPNMDNDQLGAPNYYYEDAIEGIGLYPIPSAAATVTARVIVTPAPLVQPTDIPQFPADRHTLLSWYACGMALLRNTEDPVLQSRGDKYMQLYAKQAANILSRVWRIDADFANDLMASNPNGSSSDQVQVQQG